MRTASSVILIALAVADSLVLLVDLTDYFLEDGFGIYIEGIHNYVCKTHRYTTRVVDYTAIYYLVIFTFFRVISVYLPHKNNVYCTRKRAFVAVSVTFIIMCLMNLDLVILRYYPRFDENSNFVDYDCHFNEKLANFYQYHTDFISLGLKSILPFIVLITGNSMIIYKIQISNAQRQEMTQTANQNTDDSQSMTVMLISISILFLVTQTPFIVVSLIERP